MKKISSFKPGHDVLAYHDARHEGLARQHGLLAEKRGCSDNLVTIYFHLVSIYCHFYELVRFLLRIGIVINI